MELIGGLSYLGNIINNRSNKEMLEKNNEELIDSKTDCSNIYDRNYVNTSYKKYSNLAEKRFDDSKNFKNTGVVPKYSNIQDDHKIMMNYESFGSELDSGSECSNGSMDMSNLNHFLDKSRVLVDNRKHERKFVRKQQDNNNYLSQFDSITVDNIGDPVSYNATHNNGGNHAGVSRMETERNLALHGGYSNFGENQDMTYNVVDKEHFTHDNMQPFFKKSVNYDRVAELGQQKMELFSGLKRVDWQHKKEQEPLFDPIVNIKNIYGDPSMTDFYQARYMPGRERRNELPFKQVKVGPGIGLGTNQNGGFIKGGGDLYRVLPKTVDDLRAANKPKLTYEGVVIEGQKGSRGPVPGRVVKKRPEQFKITSTKDLLKTYGYISAPKITGEINPTTLGGKNRGLLRETQYGPAGSKNTKVTTDELRGNFRKSFKQSFLQSEPSNVQLVDGLRGRSNKLDETYIPDMTQRGTETNYKGPLGQSGTDKTYAFDVIGNIPDINMRSVHNRYDRTGAAMKGDLMKGKTIDYNDVPDQNMRNVHDQTDRSGAAVSGEKGKGYYYDPKDVPEQNMRNVHDRTDRSGAAVSGEKRKGYYYDPKDVPDQNMRNVHDRTDRSGAAVKGELMKGKTIDYKDVPDQNMRNVHDRTDRSGAAVQGEKGKGYYYDPKDVPDQNMRNVHDRTDRSGVAVRGEIGKGYYYDPKDIPDQNMRNVHDRSDRSGAAVQGEKGKGYYYDPKDVPEQNMRNVHDRTDRSGAAVQGEKGKGYYYDPKDVPDQNMRNIHDRTDRSGAAVQGEKGKGYYYDPKDVPDQNMRNIHDRTDRYGAAVQGEKGKGYYYDPKDVPDQNMRNIHNYDDVNNMTGNMYKVRTVDYKDVPDQNMRNIHNYDDVNNMTGNMYKVRTVDYKDVPDQNMRNIHNYDDVNNMTGNMYKVRTVDYKDVPDQTMRNIHNYDDVNNVTGNMYKVRSIDYKDVPDQTMRNIHNYDDVGVTKGQNDKSYTINYFDATPDLTARNTYNYNDVGVAKGQHEKSYTINYFDATPDITIRETTAKKTYINPGHNTEYDKQRTRLDAHNSQVNVTREIISKGRTPMKVNYNKGPTSEFTKYRFRTKDNIPDRLVASPALQNQTTERWPINMGHNRNEKWFMNDRISSHVAENLDGNPYINNVVHKSQIIYN
jgi:hypothetical protein